MAKRVTTKKSTVWIDTETSSLSGEPLVMVGVQRPGQLPQEVKMEPIGSITELGKTLPSFLKKATPKKKVTPAKKKARPLYGQTYVIVHEVGPTEETAFSVPYEAVLKDLPTCQEVTIVTTSKLQLVFTYQNPVTNQVESRITVLSGAKYQITELIKLYARTPNVSILA